MTGHDALRDSLEDDVSRINIARRAAKRVVAIEAPQEIDAFDELWEAAELDLLQTDLGKAHPGGHQFGPEVVGDSLVTPVVIAAVSWVLDRLRRLLRRPSRPITPDDLEAIKIELVVRFPPQSRPIARRALTVTVEYLEEAEGLDILDDPSDTQHD